MKKATAVSVVILSLLLLSLLGVAAGRWFFGHGGVVYPHQPIAYELVDTCPCLVESLQSHECGGLAGSVLSCPKAFFLYRHSDHPLYQCCSDLSMVLLDTTHQYLLTYGLLLTDLWCDTYERRRLNKGNMCAAATFDTLDSDSCLRLYRLEVEWLSWPKHLGGPT